MMHWVALWGLFRLLLAWVGTPPENYYNAANRLFAARDFIRAEALYRKIWQSPPGRFALFPFRAEALPALKFKALYNAGNAAYLREDWKQAVQDYEAALHLDPGDEDAWNNLGLAQARLQGKEGARESLGPPQGQNREKEAALPADIFTLPPAALADYIRDLTRAGYPFRPGSSLKPEAAPPSQSDEVDW